jgi:uncharacterized protein YeaO (DUF488 family)
MLRLKRAYDPPSASDGYRVLVDRLWPRGLSKQAARIDEWLEELAPSTELRKWFGHDPARFSEFRQRYERELEAEEVQPLLDALAKRVARGSVTLVYGARDEEHNNAVVLARVLERRQRRPKPSATRSRHVSKAEATRRTTPRSRDGARARRTSRTSS